MPSKRKKTLSVSSDKLNRFTEDKEKKNVDKTFFLAQVIFALFYSHFFGWHAQLFALGVWRTAFLWASTLRVVFILVQWRKKMVFLISDFVFHVFASTKSAFNFLFCFSRFFLCVSVGGRCDVTAFTLFRNV